ncbi:MAG TPA: hypothetical protein VJY41_07260 [Prolixibacteraceae bacterium]|nr:hypothetical protein [Prolixibacteraceae bacterium]
MPPKDTKGELVDGLNFSVHAPRDEGVVTDDFRLTPRFRCAQTRGSWE